MFCYLKKKDDTIFDENIKGRLQHRIGLSHPKHPTPNQATLISRGTYGFKMSLTSSENFKKSGSFGSKIS